MEYLNTAASTAFVNEVQLPDSAMNLARAGLYFAKSIYTNIDCGWYVGQLDIIAEAVTKRIAPGASFLEQLAALNNYLFTELGYAGNVDSYYDPKNSFFKRGY